MAWFKGKVFEFNGSKMFFLLQAIHKAQRGLLSVNNKAQHTSPMR